MAREYKSEDYNHIREWLDPQLIARGLSIEKFSRLAEISKASVYYYRADTNRPDEQTMARMCRVLNVPLAEGLRQYTPKVNGRPTGSRQGRKD